MQKTAELKVLPVSVLKPAEYNPRKKLKAGDKEYEKIKNSIEEFGFADPLVVNSDMTIIGGHQRLTVAMDLGYTEVPCAVVDIDKVREKALKTRLPVLGMIRCWQNSWRISRTATLISGRQALIRLRSIRCSISSMTSRSTRTISMWTLNCSSRSSAS